MWSWVKYPNKVFVHIRQCPMSIITYLYHKIDTFIGRGECPICGKEMLKNNIQKHIRVKHSQQENADCPQCGKIFKTSYYMKDHLRIVHGIGKNSYLK